MDLEDTAWSQQGRDLCAGSLQGRCSAGLRGQPAPATSPWGLLAWQTLSVQLSPSVLSARQASLSITNSQSLHKLMSIESVMPSNYFVLCCPLLLLPSIFPNIRIFSNESALHIRLPNYWSFSFNISPSNEYSGLIS